MSKSANISTFIIAEPAPTLSQRFFKTDSSNPVNLFFANNSGGFSEHAYSVEAYSDEKPNSAAVKSKLWNTIQSSIIHNALAGINSSVIVSGDMDDRSDILLNESDGLLQKVFQGVVLDPKSITMGMDLISVATCVEVHTEKVRDVLSKADGFSDKKARGARPYIDGLKEAPLTAETVQTIQKHELKDEDSSLVVNFHYKVKDCGVTRFSIVTMALISRGSKVQASINYSRVLQAATEHSTKKKKTFIPYKDSIVTLMVSECLGSGSFKTFLVPCIAGHFESETSKDEITAIIKSFSKARAISMPLKPNEEEVSLYDIKSEMAQLKQKLAQQQEKETLKEDKSKKEEISKMQEEFQNQLGALEATRDEKNREYAKLKKEREARDAELQQIQAKLQDKKLAAAEAIKAQEELAELERIQDETDRKMIEEEKLRVIREAELEDARELENIICRMKEEQKEKEEAARQEALAAQARNMASIFRAAFNLTRDRAEKDALTASIANLQNQEEVIQKEIVSLNLKVDSAKLQEEAFRNMSEKCEVQTRKFEEKKEEEDSTFKLHINQYLDNIKGMKEETRDIHAQFKEIDIEKEKAIQEASQDIRVLNAPELARLREEVANIMVEYGRQSERNIELVKRYKTTLDLLEPKRQTLEKLLSEIRKEEVLEEDLVVTKQKRTSEVAILEKLYLSEEEKLLKLSADLKTAIQRKEDLTMEKELLEQNHENLTSYLDEHMISKDHTDNEYNSRPIKSRMSLIGISATPSMSTGAFSNQQGRQIGTLRKRFEAKLLSSLPPDAVEKRLYQISKIV
eukprot:Tbor_TRINITY_DN4120_c0_g1::TRINITY_DN4120_c0_g1_i1::g.26569::m.26569